MDDMKVKLVQPAGHGMTYTHNLVVKDGEEVQVCVEDHELSWPLRVIGVFYQRVVALRYDAAQSELVIRVVK